MVAIDNSVTNPGQQGWWINPRESILRTFYRERVQWELLEDEVPLRVTRQPVKNSDPVILEHIREKQQAAGIDEGIDLLCLFIVLGLEPLSGREPALLVPFEFHEFRTHYYNASAGCARSF